MNNEEIKIKNSKILLFVGIVAGVIWLIVEISLFKDVLSGKYTWGLVIFGSIYSTIVLGTVGTLAISDYIKHGRRMSAILERYGEANIINHIRNNRIRTYKKNELDNKVYFTDTFVAEPSTAIFHYNEISWMYKDVSERRKRTRITIAFKLLDGNTFFLCDGVQDDDITNIMHICQHYNPNIIFGYSKEKEAQHSLNIKRYKEGLSQVSHAPVPIEEMRESNGLSRAKARIIFGISMVTIAVMAIVMWLFVFEDVMDEEFLTFLAGAMGVVAVLGVLTGTIGVMGMVDERKNNG